MTATPKLTPAQREALELAAERDNERITAPLVTLLALNRRGLATAPVGAGVTYGGPYAYLTDAGRDALAANGA